MAGAAMVRVESQMDQMQAWAESSRAAAEGALTALGNTEIQTAYPTQYGTPTIKDFTPEKVSYPSDMVISAAPEIADIEIPEKPDKPDITDPELGDLYSIVLPTPPTVTFPAIDITAPVYDISAPLPWSFEVGKISVLDDPLVKVIRERLTSNIQDGGTGLLEEIETAIWQRDLERNEQQLEDTTDKVVAMWAKKGFSLPDGMLAHSLAEVQKEYMNKMLDRTREIAIKQAELEQTNLFKSMEIGTTLIGVLIGTMIKYEELVFQAQQATAKFANEYISIQIQAYSSKVEAYRATAQVYEAILRAEVAKVEIYKAEVEAQKVVGEINVQTIQVYSEQIRATIALTERYKTEVEAMVAELNVEKAKIEANKLQFDAWAKEADVAMAKYNAGTEMFKAQSLVNIQTAEFQGKQAEMQITAWVKAQELNLRSFEVATRSMDHRASIILEAQKGVASVAGSMAAGAMAALSAQASMKYEETMTVPAS